MYPTILDLKTGERHLCKDRPWDCSVFWWTDGNGACDCNRALAIKKRTEWPEYAKQFSEGICLGCKRFLIVDVHGDLEGQSKESIIAEANAGYISQ